MTHQLDIDVKTIFAAIVAHSPEPGPTPNGEVRSLTAANTFRSHRVWLAVSAASIVAVGVAAVASLSSPANQSPLATPSPIASDLPATTLPDFTVTTITYATPEVAPVGAVVCLDAGAGQTVTDLCVQEWGGDSFEASKINAESFVMPVDPANPEDQASAVAVADALGLSVQPFDASFIPVGITLSEEATVFLVLGTSRDGYNLPDAGAVVIVPAGSVLRFSDELPGVGTVSVYDTADQSQVCLVVGTGAGGSGGCADQADIENGQSWAYIKNGSDAPAVLIGLTATNIGFRVTIDGTTVTPDDRGLWYTIVPTGATEFTITTDHGSQVVPLLNGPGVQTTSTIAVLDTGP